jgi:hypothetical protein
MFTHYLAAAAAELWVLVDAVHDTVGQAAIWNARICALQT